MAEAKTCKFCGEGPLIWKHFEGTGGGRWHLVTKTGRVHECLREAARKAKAAKVRRVTRSYKPSTWRRGKSPASYG